MNVNAVHSPFPLIEQVFFPTQGTELDPVLSWEIGSETDGNQAHAVRLQRGPQGHGHLHAAGRRQDAVLQA